jgi:hypothetical protein
VYAVYEDARDEVECCLAAWREAPFAHRGEAFAVYRAAADREDAAAAAWLRACAAYDAANRVQARPDDDRRLALFRGATNSGLASLQ